MSESTDDAAPTPHPPLERRSVRFVSTGGYEWHWPRTAPDGEPLPLLVALHGMGQSGRDFATQIAPLLSADRAVLLPDGPLPFEVHEKSGRRRGHAWYIFTGDQDEFLRSAAETESWLHGLIETVAREFPIDRRRITLLGYSQGGYLAGMMTFRRPEVFAASIVMAARLKTEILPDGSPRHVVPILAMHGRHDRLVDPDVVQRHVEVLSSRGWPVEFRTYDAGHRISDDARSDMSSWLSDRSL